MARMRGPAFFIGDLDPMDLTVFAALRSGEPGFRTAGRMRLDVRYVGIDDAWLRLYRKSARKGLARDYGALVMPSIEKEHLCIVRELCGGRPMAV